MKAIIEKPFKDGVPLKLAPIPRKCKFPLSHKGIINGCICGECGGFTYLPDNFVRYDNWVNYERWLLRELDMVIKEKNKSFESFLKKKNIPHSSNLKK